MHHFRELSRKSSYYYHACCALQLSEILSVDAVIWLLSTVYSCEKTARVKAFPCQLHAKSVEQPPSTKRLCTGLPFTNLYLSKKYFYTNCSYLFVLFYAALLDVREIDLNAKQGSLVAKLKLDPKKDSDFVPLPGPLLRKYIAYARTYIFPRLLNLLSLVFKVLSTFSNVYLSTCHLIQG